MEERQNSKVGVLRIWRLHLRPTAEVKDEPGEDHCEGNYSSQLWSVWKHPWI